MPKKSKVENKDIAYSWLHIISGIQKPDLIMFVLATSPQCSCTPGGPGQAVQYRDMYKELVFETWLSHLQAMKPR